MKNGNHDHGFSLFEVLVAWAILATVLLSLVSYEAILLKTNLNNYWQVQAVIQVNSMLERLRVNRDSSFRNREIEDWNQLNRQLLPHALGEVACQTHWCRVRLQWQEKQLQEVWSGGLY